MSCEAEEAAVEQAQEELTRAQAECAGLTHEDPEWLHCMGEVVYWEAQLSINLAALRECRTATRLLMAEGYVTFLRVHELGSGWGGGQSNVLNAEVIFKLDSEPKKAFGFQTREDEYLPARQGMLSILRDAMTNDLKVTVDYFERVATPNQNSYVLRIAVSKASPSPPHVVTQPGQVFR